MDRHGWRMRIVPEARPGAFIFVGNRNSAGPDPNDDVIPIGASYWVKLVETALAS